MLDNGMNNIIEVSTPHMADASCSSEDNWTNNEDNDTATVQK